MTEPQPLLQTRGLEAGYGDFRALFGIDFHIAPGETVAVIGSNGAGKTTFLRCLLGVVQASAGEIMLEGERINRLPPHLIARRGIAMVPEGRCLFRSLTVEENLLVGLCARRSGPWTLESVYALFPALAERRRQFARTLSGGQQQMVAIGRALLANPRMLLCDEISLGLAPVVTRDFYAKLPQIRSGGMALVIVEQDINQALSVADRMYCFQEGRVPLTGPTHSVERERILSAYFGV
jgi:branched-chain amino acid transport system ATP-binding protein